MLVPILQQRIYKLKYYLFAFNHFESDYGILWCINIGTYFGIASYYSQINYLILTRYSLYQSVLPMCIVYLFDIDTNDDF